MHMVLIFTLTTAVPDFDFDSLSLASNALFPRPM